MSLYLVFAAIGFLFGGFAGAAIGVLTLFIIEIILSLM